MTIPVINGNAVANMDAEPTVAPAHQFFDELLVYLAFIFQHGKNFGTEYLFQFLGLSLEQAMEGAIGSEEAVGDNGMEEDETWRSHRRCGSP